MNRSVAANAELALLLEVAATPKPGNVDREREYDDLRFEHFLAGAVGAREGLAAAAEGGAVGEAFETAVAGMAAQRGGNTQFGALLLLAPLARAAGEDRLSREDAAAVAGATTVADAAAFYRAFDHVDVFVADPPEDWDDLDVRRGSGAVPAVEERGVTLFDALAVGADDDGVAAEWTGGFERTFETATRIQDREGPVPARAARAFLALLAEQPDTLVAKRHGADTATEVSERAADLLDADRTAVRAFAEELVERGINPGTTADVVAAGLFVALERGVEV